MPELAFVFFLGVIISVAANGLYGWLWYRRVSSKKSKILCANLGKIGLFYSESQGALISAGLSSLKEEESKVIKTQIFAGLFLSILSWLGLVFSSLIFLSLRYLARSRLETKLFGGELAQRELLDVAEISDLVESIQGAKD